MSLTTLTVPESILVGIAIAAALILLRAAVRTVATIRARAAAPIVARLLSRLVGRHDYDDERFFSADGAPERWIRTRQEGLRRLSAALAVRHRESRGWSSALRGGFSDLRFTDANRVPFPFVQKMRASFDLSAVVTESRGPRLVDLDGNVDIDISGSYGLNVAGFDRYKQWMDEGWQRVRDLGPVLGPLHPVVAENVTILKRVSGQPEVSFHMSGTEAVMAAVRLARFNTRRKLIVCFAGAYHGWWDGVVAGLGSERSLPDCLTLRDMDQASLTVIRMRAHEIAAVLVNPVQSFHPNSPPPNDAILLTSDVRRVREANQAYGAWVRALRACCTEAGVPLVFDEVYTGFRLAPGGAQELFGVRADMVVYGKTVAGGLPIGVVCGSTPLMRRFDPGRPMRLAYVVGTFSAHPLVMGAMNAFLRWAASPAAEAEYSAMNRKCAEWIRATNEALADEELPVRLVHFGTIWSVLFTEAGRYNWLLQYYLRECGVVLSWVGTGRCLVSMDFTPDDYDDLRTAIVAAARQMRQDGWWLTATQHPERERRMRMRLLGELWGSIVRVPAPLRGFYTEVMLRKEDDHHASHNNAANQMLHLLSSSVFLYCYAAFFYDLTWTMCLGMAALFARQFGHAVLEPDSHEKEMSLLGYSTRNKTLILLAFLAIPAVNLIQAGSMSLATIAERLPVIAEQWFACTCAVVFGRVAYLLLTRGFRAAMVWYVKLVSDPITDVITYFPRRTQRA